MKRMSNFIILIVCLVIVFTVQLQSQSNPVWETKWNKIQPASLDESDPNNWMFGDRMYTGLAYDTTRDVVYIISPSSGIPDVYAFDAETGDPALQIGGELATPGHLYVDTNIVNGGYEKFSLYKIAVDEDGRIYACNAVVPAQDSGEAFKVYRWKDDGSAPELIYEYTPPQTTEVLGTAFEVAGKRHLIGGHWHDSTRIYVSTSSLDSNGTGDDELHILAADTRQNAPHDFRLVQRIVNPDTTVRYFGAGIAPVTVNPTNFLFVSSPGNRIRKIREYKDSSTPPLVQPVKNIETYSSTANIGGALAVFQNYFDEHYLFNGRMKPSTGNVLDPNYNNVGEVFLINWSIGRYPLGWTPYLTYNIPAIIAGSWNYIVDIDYKIWSHREYTSIKYEQLYYLVSNGGIACFKSKTPLWVPVELSSFTAHLEGNTVMLDWSTASETNNYGFEVERSFGGTWERIGFVEGHGTTTAAQEYSWSEPLTPARQQSGVIQYRLRQVDFDGTFEYSPEVEVVTGSPESVALHQNYPNPFNPGTTIRYYIDTPVFVSIDVYNIYGQKVASLVNAVKDEGMHPVEFHSGRLPSGVYIYSLNAGGRVLRKTMNIVK